MSEDVKSVENTEEDVGSKERTFLVLKTDIASNANIVRDIVYRITQMGLRNIAIKTLVATREECMALYAKDREWREKQGQRKIDQGFADPNSSPEDVGQGILELMADYMTSGPMVMMIVEGENAVERVARFVGTTEPASAAHGTLRRMYSNDSYALANRDGRALRNVAHCSDSVGEAGREIPIWFPEEATLEIDSASLEAPEQQ